MTKKDIKNLKKQYNNYIYPKPINDIENEFIKKNKVLYSDPNFSWHKLWPEKKYSTNKLSVLIAGCGSDQAAILAKCNPKHNFIGVDLSEKSLEHQNKLINKHNINNLILYCDDFRKIKFANKFNYIISTGVIHHLEEPGSALDYFNKNLLDDGVIYLMVYGDKNSYSINQLKKIFNILKLGQDDRSIKLASNLVNKLHNNHPAKIFSKNTSDYNHSSGIVDFLLHKQETFFSIKELVSLLSSNNLIIKNFFNGNISSVTKYFLDDEEAINEIRKLPTIEKWNLGQILNWNDRKIEIICTKKNNKKNSIVYNHINLDNVFTYMNRNIKYRLSNEHIETYESETMQNLKFKLPKNSNIDLKKILEGQIRFSDLMKECDNNSKIIFKKIITIMIENSLLDFSYHPIEKYINYYNK